MFILLISSSSHGAEPGPVFLGQDSCSSSGCHGGAGARKNQSLVWTRHDPHARASATLTTARSKSMAQVLKIPDAAQDRSCISCHAPMQGLARELLGAALRPHAEAVSCETCHGGAAEWIRSHTRPDLTRAEKVLDGLRDLSAFYNRANVCVACHQVVEPKLIGAGHPELFFELDGQTTGMTRHWIEKDADYRLKGWLVGQAAALREVTAQTREQKKVGLVAPHTSIQWEALSWILARAMPDAKIATASTNILNDIKTLSQFHQWADSLALETSVQSRRSALKLLLNLTATSDEFTKNADSSAALVRRAERLVLAVERLVLCLPTSLRQKIDGGVGDLFALVQSRPAFDAPKFGARLQHLHAVLSTEPAPEDPK